MDVYTFGRKLIASNDLDPVYVMLWEANLDDYTLKRWLLAYWCFYHSGTASWIATANTEKNFWVRFKTASASSSFPRCTERRHFRGELAQKTTNFLEKKGVDRLFEPIVGTVWQADSLIHYVKTWVGFGPWIAFKVADMIERVGIASVEFNTDTIELFDSPREGAQLHFAEHARQHKTTMPSNIVSWSIHKICESLKDLNAPPDYARQINVQEAETILCKWKSYLNGHYQIGEDLTSLRRSLKNFVCPLSRKLLKAVPSCVMQS